MKRGLVLGILVAVGVASLAVTASTQQGEMVVEVEQVQNNLYVLKGGGGNSAAFVTARGVVLVDTKLAGWGQPILGAIETFTTNPVTTIINTHTHPDHAGSNLEFAPTVAIVAHENTERLMAEWNPVSGLGREKLDSPFNPDDGRGLPTQTFADQMSIGSGLDRVDLYHFGPGHTGGDAWVVFPSVRVMHAGDMFPAQMVPIMDANNGGSGLKYATTLWNAYAAVQDIDTIITGHDGLMTREDLRNYASYVGGFVTAARQAKMRGWSAEQFATTWQVPPRFRGYAKTDLSRVTAWTQVIFDELDKEGM